MNVSDVDSLGVSLFISAANCHDCFQLLDISAW